MTKRELKNMYKEIHKCTFGTQLHGKQITGAHYFYLNYCKVDKKKPSFLETDRRIFEFINETEKIGKKVIFIKKRQGNE